jgi:hypothetical protein
LEKQLGTTADRSFGFGLLYLLLEPFTLLNDNCIVTGSPSFNTILQGRYTYPSSFGCCERAVQIYLIDLVHVLHWEQCVQRIEDDGADCKA